ncbi:hypothetical protein MSG28_002118 [Choristoneura fumiferana]|uniref:Uncharacterized protein n=1 Tax=Choristoneura fumiferana TaxID=7141 RepID=A0ACC0JUT5_CHOFU|nr:hypothetical protein MSG28_002118 [Choristoneura fumiferana]
MNICRNRLALSARYWPKLIRRCMSTNPPTVVECGPDLQERGTCAIDPCDPDKCYPSPRVVIIGAGMAGLSAAGRLSQRGINNFVVLEAYERPGGRIHSCFLGDVVCELGAHWRSAHTTNHPIYEISASENPPRPGVPGAAHPRGLFNRVVTGKMEYPPTLAAYYKFRQIEQEAAALYCLGGSKQQGSLINFISLRIQQELHEFPLDQQHDAARIMFGMAHSLSARCGDDTAMLSGCSEGCFMNMPGGVTRVPLGLLATLAPILRQIPEGCIRYCRPVNCVYWGTSQKTGYRATVCTTDGEEFPCDYVICTVSLGVLRANSAKLFCPALPASKMDAMRCLGFGAYSFDCGCLDGDCQRALGCPIPGPSEPFPPILLFAGEATVPGHFATVAGARLSGVREAERIIQLTLQFQGPPLPVPSCRPDKESRNMSVRAASVERQPGHGRRRAALRARPCRWRAAGARKKTSRQMRDAARRIRSPPRAVRVRSPAPPYPHKTHRYRRLVVTVVVVEPGAWRVVARGAWRRGQVRARGPRGPGGSRSRQAGDARRPARGAFLLNCDRDQVTSATFGGPALDVLYVTSASLNRGVEQKPPCGSTFRVTGLDVKGHPNVLCISTSSKVLTCLKNHHNISICSRFGVEYKRQLNVRGYECSPNLRFVLFQHNIKEVYRQTFTAYYTIYDVTNESWEWQHAAWLGTEGALLLGADNEVLARPGPPAKIAPLLRLTDDAKEVTKAPSSAWGSADGTLVLYVQYDDSAVSELRFPRIEQGIGGVGASRSGFLLPAFNQSTPFAFPDHVTIRYPTPGSSIPRVKLSIVAVQNSTSPPRWEIKPPNTLDGMEYYLISAQWVGKDNSHVGVVWMNRAQNLTVYSSCYAPNWTCTETHSEKATDEPWLEVHQQPVYSEDGSAFLLLAAVQEGGGQYYTHIKHVDVERQRLAVLSHGKVEVAQVLAWDEINHLVYYLGSAERPGQRHVYVVQDPSYGGGSNSVRARAEREEPRCLTCELGVWQARLHYANCSYWSATFSPPKPSVGITHYVLESVRLRELALPTRRSFDVQLGSGNGRPGSQQVTEEFMVDWGTYMSSRNDVVYVKLDVAGARGLPRALLRGRLGGTFKYLDVTRVAVWGWGYGGYVTTMLLGSQQDTLKCGIARAHHVPPHALYLLHGMADMSAPYPHALQLARALTDAGVLFRHQTYADEGHELKGVIEHVYRSMEDYLRECLSLDPEDTKLPPPDR